MGSEAVLVVGSVNFDYVVRQDRLPRRGETLTATELHGSCGGKGANQAVQASRLGSSVSMIGASGCDPNGAACLEALQAQGVAAYMRPSASPNGLGIVHVTGDGEVYSTIVEGANADVDPSWVAQNAALIRSAAVVILQNEIPASANEKAVELSVAASVPVIFNAAPALEISREVTRGCAWFVVNEEEASTYLGHPLGDLEDDGTLRRALAGLRTYCENVVLTLGSSGSYVALGEDVRFVPAVPTSAIDTTGAGDSFIGAFAHALVSGEDPFDAARTATMAASLTVRGYGAQTSMPTGEELRREVVRQA